MTVDSQLPFSFPAVCRKKVSAAFDGGRLTSDGGVLLLAGAEKRLGLVARLAACLADPRDPSRVIHGLPDILRARMLAAMVDLYWQSYAVPPTAVTLDIDDTVDVVHGAQQLSFWNGFHGERCFLPIHVYDTSGRPVAMILRTGKTPGGSEIAKLLARLLRRIRRHWPDTHITLRGDRLGFDMMPRIMCCLHYGRPEVMDWCDDKGLDYIFGLAGNAVLHRDPGIVTVADALCVKRAEHKAPVLRRYAETSYAETSYAAKSWKHERRVAARIEASTLGLDIRFVVTSLAGRNAEYLYDTLYCARGQAENLIKRHKSGLASDRTSCRSALANQVRLILHSAAYWLMWKVQDAMPTTSPLKTCEFSTLRNRLLKVAARIIETASRIRLRLASACPRCRAVPPTRHHPPRRIAVTGAAVPPSNPVPQTTSIGTHARPRKNTGKITASGNLKQWAAPIQPAHHE
jgi:hypothetical protein